jgi:hypothetical protein
VRQRFSALLDGPLLHIELDRDGFAAGQPLRISLDLKSCVFTLENRAAQPNETHLQFAGLPAGRYNLKTPQATRDVTPIAGGQLTGKVAWGVRKYRAPTLCSARWKAVLGPCSHA